MTLIGDIEHIASKIRDGFVFVFHTIEHEVPMVLSTLVNIYGPKVVADAIATHKAGVVMYADKAIETADADVKALVQSTLVKKHLLPPTAAQFIASGIHHLFTIGEDKINALIEKGANAAIAATGASTAQADSTQAAKTT